MGNTTFSGPIRSKSTLKAVSKNSTTGTIKFENVDNKRVQCFLNFRSGFDSLGKHYKLRSEKNLEVHRQYTISNTM